MSPIDQAQVNTGQLLYLAPLLILAGGVVILIAADVFSRRLALSRGLGAAPATLISILATLAAAVSCIFPLWRTMDGSGQPAVAELFYAIGPQASAKEGPSWWGAALSIDRFGTLTALALCLILLATIISLGPYLQRRRLYRPELFPLVLLSACGMVLLGFSRDLLLTFAAVELLSLPLYVLCGLNAREPLGRESSLKYFLLGAFASGFFIYGAALVYGAIGHLNYSAIVFMINNHDTPDGLLLAGLALVGVGLAFKLALVPFHAWVPDVYQGAPTPITGFMAAGVKFAAAAAFIRLVVEAVRILPVEVWQPALVTFAVLSMAGGNLLALHQMSLKRLLACSAIAHTGYLAVGLAAGTSIVSGSLLVYLVTYAISALGAFILVSYLAPDNQDDIYLDQTYQLYQRAPLACLALAILLLSLGGFPLTAGFIGKLLVFRDAWDAGLSKLVIFALLNSVVSFYYYLRVVMALYMQPEVPGTPPLAVLPMPRAYAVTLVTLVALTLVLGIMPENLLGAAEKCQLTVAVLDTHPPGAAHVETSLPIPLPAP